MKSHCKPYILITLGVYNHFYHSESTFEIRSLCNSIVPQIWHLVLHNLIRPITAVIFKLPIIFTIGSFLLTQDVTPWFSITYNHRYYRITAHCTINNLYIHIFSTKINLVQGIKLWSDKRKRVLILPFKQIHFLPQSYVLPQQKSQLYVLMSGWMWIEMPCRDVIYGKELNRREDRLLM